MHNLPSEQLRVIEFSAKWFATFPTRRRWNEGKSQVERNLHKLGIKLIPFVVIALRRYWIVFECRSANGEQSTESQISI